MKDYKITINVSDVGGVYSARDIEEAKEIAQSECNDIYARLRSRCRVEVESVEEVKG